MRNRNLTYLLPLATVAVSGLVGCKGKTGPEGPAGLPGPTGPAGNPAIFVSSAPITCSTTEGTVTVTIMNTGLGTLYCNGIGVSEASDNVNNDDVCTSGNYLQLVPGTSGAVVLGCYPDTLGSSSILITGTITCTDSVSGLTSLLDFTLPASTTCT